jgi:hypothetical protein
VTFNRRRRLPHPALLLLQLLLLLLPALLCAVDAAQSLQAVAWILPSSKSHTMAARML